ncbi:MAG: YHS domain-containing protein [Candidatus Auribacterota bacterium]
MFRLVTAFIMATLLLCNATFLFAGDAQEECPVMGGNVNKEIFADYNGKRVYFCCSGCVDAFNKDPEKYLKVLEEQGVEPADSPKAE